MDVQNSLPPAPYLVETPLSKPGAGSRGVSPEATHVTAVDITMREDTMTARKTTPTEAARKRKPLTVAKRTLKDLQGPGDGPKGGWIRPPISWSCPQPTAGPRP